MAKEQNNKKKATYQGTYKFNDIMTDYMEKEPAEDDAAGQAIKNTFQANMIQTALNADVAEDLAYTNAGIAKSNMKTFYNNFKSTFNL